MKDMRIGNPEREREKLRRYMQEHAFRVGKFRLTSGKMSGYYFNSKNVILTAEGAYLVARAFLERIRGIDVEAIGGAAMGAVPLAGSLAPLCYQEGLAHIKFFIDRKEAKKHGDSKRIEGPPLEPGARIIVVEDVVTTGGSALGTACYLREQGFEIVKVLALLDRKEGASRAFAEQDIILDAVFNIDDFDLGS
ncbi:MAG: orotate phosphoribosyltransferase [Firmicutes bacterium]|nr:orotate phosphoribosyltransferase [Bacillota bacterium]